MLRTYSLFLLTLFLCFPVFAQTDTGEGRIEGELILRLKEGIGFNEFLGFSRTFNPAAIGLSRKKQLSDKFNIHLIQFDPAAIDGERLLRIIRQQPDVLAAQHNYFVQMRQLPNDPEFDKQWGARVIQATEVWDFSTGGLTTFGDTIVVAILDSGFDIEHEDLINNIWHNQGENPDDGSDNDQNGFIDDDNGWNFIDDNKAHPPDAHGHSVAGIIGAQGNNGIGVSGINWNVKLMLLTINTVDQIIAAYEYVIDQRERYNNSNGSEGAFVVATNASFGQSRKFCGEQPVWGGMYDLLGQVGILTAAATANNNWDVDEVGDMPTTCLSNFIITVLNTNIDDEKHQGSAFGSISIDMGAPGDASFTTKPFDNYGEFNGNSASAPHLSGAIALLYSLPCANLTDAALSQPAQTALIVRQALLQGVDALDDLQGKTTTGGRLNVFNAMNILQEQCEGTTGELDILNLYPNPTPGLLFIEYETPDFENYDLRVFNALGQLMYKETIAPLRFSIKKHKIDTDNWARGVYFFVIGRDNSIVSKGFVVH